MQDSRLSTNRVPESRQDEIAGVALVKTLVFLFLSVPVVFLAMALTMLLPELLLVDIPDWVFPGLRLALEALLMWLVARHDVGKAAHPFNEKHLVIGCNVLAILSYVAFGLTLEGTVVRWVVNGAMVLFVTVFFVVKTLLSRRLRIEVLGALVLPLAQYLV
jgi:hypothetical protein